MTNEAGADRALSKHYLLRRTELEKDIADRLEIMIINIKKEYDDMFENESYFEIIDEQLKHVRTEIFGLKSLYEAQS